MEYVQLNETGTEATPLTGSGRITWDANNFCSVEALIRDGKADQFRVVPLIETPSPTYDSTTHKCFRDGCEKIGETWQYKWTVVPYTEVELEQQKQRLRELMVVSPWQIRKALNALNLRSIVETLVEQSPQEIQDAWEFASEFRRLDPLVLSIAVALSKSDLEIDYIFKVALQNGVIDG